jgi:hypothetical protein
MRIGTSVLTAVAVVALNPAGGYANQSTASTSTSSGDYTFNGGYPTPETVQKAYDAADLNRAVQMYRIFYPTVSGAAIFKGSMKAGVIPNKLFGTLDTQPKHRGFTLNSDTPYGGVLLDLNVGPLVIELPPGPLLGAALDINQRWVADMGIPGPDAGKGGKHLLLPPGYTGEAPAGYYAARATSYRAIAGMRSLPVGGDIAGAIERIKTLKVYPLNPSARWAEPKWFDMTPTPQDTSPFAWEDNLQYWQGLYEVVDSEPPFEGYREHYGELAALGIVKGEPFAPDARMQHILEQAARLGSAQMRVESFADRRPDRVVRPARQGRRVSRRGQVLQAQRASARSGQAVLVGDGLRRRNPQPGPERPGQGGVALAV